jgi:phosphoglycerate dehydrogenase-like enzyme
VTLRIAVIDDYQRVAARYADWSRLSTREVVFFHEPLGDASAVIAALEGFDIVCAMRERTAFPRAVLDRLTRLRLLVTTGMANAAIDVDAARSRGVVVCGTEGSGQSTAELTWALILATARRVPQEDRALRSGTWQTSVGVGLAGKTLGVLGLGRIGTQVARIGAAFDMHVVAWSQNLTEDASRAAGAEPVAKDELFARADVLTIHVRLSDRTRGLVGGAELRQMKPSAILVNTSRGPVVDELALVSALERGELAGAGLDVFDREPLPAGNPILRAPNTVLTPHLGYVADDVYRVFYEQTVEDVAAFLAGTPIRVVRDY